MRKYYESQTLANFSMYAGLRFEINQITTLEEMLPLIANQLSQKTTHEKNERNDVFSP